MNARYTERTWTLFVGFSACTRNTCWLNQAQTDTGRNFRDWLFFSSQTRPCYKIWMEWLQRSGTPSLSLKTTETHLDLNSNTSKIIWLIWFRDTTASLWAVQKVKDRSVHFSHQQIIWSGICTDRGPRAHFSSDCLEGWVRITSAANSCSLSPAWAPLQFLVHKRGAAWLSICNSSDTFCRSVCCQGKQEAEFLIAISYRGPLEDLITDSDTRMTLSESQPQI